MTPTLHIVRHADLGNARYSWLHARHHFSFGRYWNPQRTGFGTLLVINDDEIAPHSGFGAHPHDNMEIITYIREGAIHHQDNFGHAETTPAGSVQVMSAGSGITHSEHNTTDTATRLYQIWITPNQENVAPRYEQRVFPAQHGKSDGLTLLVSGRSEDAGKGAAFIYQDAAIWGGSVTAGREITVPIKHQAYLLVAKGAVDINGQTVNQGDGAEITGMPDLHLTALSDAEILVIDVPAA